MSVKEGKGVHLSSVVQAVKMTRGNIIPLAILCLVINMTHFFWHSLDLSSQIAASKERISSKKERKSKKRKVTKLLLAFQGSR